MTKLLKGILFFILLLNVARAQDKKPDFWDDIQAFKKQDSLHFPGTNKILFVGSSSFTKWTDVQSYFPSYPIINRGFGGSSITDLIRYEQDVIFAYNPKQIVIYCGENDLVGSDTVTVRLVFERFKKLFTDIRSKFPGIPIIYISMKPSPSRWNLKEKMMEGNELIRKYFKQNKKAVFISIWRNMLGPDGKPRDALFIEDKLHMNAKGYAIWQKAIEPYLKK